MSITITAEEAQAIARVILSFEEEARALVRVIEEKERLGCYERRGDASRTVDIAVSAASRFAKGHRLCL